MNAPETDILHRALASLAEHGVKTRVRSGPHGSADAHVDLSRGNARQAFSAIVKRTLRPSTVAQVVDHVSALQQDRPLIVAEHVSDETASLLRARGLAYLDVAGNAFIDTPNFLVAIAGRRPSPERPTPARERVGAAAWQVAFVLLRDQDAFGLTVRALAERAGVSHAAAAMALHALDARGWIQNLGRRGHPIVQPEALLSSWLTGFVDHIQPRIALARATAPGKTPADWAREVATNTQGTHLIGGELGAELGGQEIRGTTGSVYVTAWDAATLRRLRLVPTPQGAIAVRRPFAPDLADPTDPRLVDPLIVLAEVAAIPDERLDGTRASLRKLVSARIPT